MWDRFLEYASRIVFLQRDVADIKSSDAARNDDIIALRKEVQHLTLGLQQAMSEIQRLHDRLDHEGEQSRLRLENEMLKFERRLPPGSIPPSDRDDDDR